MLIADLSITENNGITQEEKNLIMLAVSNLRFSESAVEYSLNMAIQYKELLILFINDLDFSNCSLGVGGWFVGEGLLLSNDNELGKNNQKNLEQIEKIVKKANLLEIKTKTRYTKGEFALRVLEAVNDFRPEVIVTTRRWRYKWQRLIFGSHVDWIKKQANCQVIEF